MFFLIHAELLLNRTDFLECKMMSMSQPVMSMYCLAKFIKSIKSFLLFDGKKFSISNTAKVCSSLYCMLKNQLITGDEFFHWLSQVFCLIVVLMFLRISFVIGPISLFAGLMRLHVSLFWKMSLRSLSEMNTCLFAIHSVRSWMLRFARMFLASLLMLMIALSFAFLYVVVMLSASSLLCVALSIW